MESNAMNQFMSSTRFRPTAFPSTEKVSSRWSNIQAPAGRHRYTSYCLCHCRFPGNLRNTGLLLQKTECNLLHALPLEAVTTDNGPEGSASLFSSVKYAGIPQAEKGARQSFPYKIRNWYARARNQNGPVTFMQVMEKLRTELQTAEKIHILQEIKRSRWTMYVMHSWAKMQAWIKWPIAIFLPWFLFISAFYGLSVSMDLLPLWIIGPLMAGITVKAGMKISASCRQRIERVRTGNFPLRLVEVAKSRYVEAKLQITKSMSVVMLFIRSGEVIVVLRQYMYRKLMEQWEVWADRLEDWRLVYLRLERTLKNIV